MTALNNKIDFAVVIGVNHANPNGDPLGGNRPRQDYEYIGEITDVCLKRKIRNRLMQEGYDIFVQSDDLKMDEFKSLSDRFKAASKDWPKDGDSIKKEACRKWIDVRAFGQVFAFQSDEKKNKKSKKNGEENENSEEAANGKNEKGVSIGVRGPVTIQSAYSFEPVVVTSTQITKSVNSETGDRKSSDTMGMKHRVDFGVYKAFGSINVELAKKTGFAAEDAEAIKEALKTLFMNDASSARPEGSMEVIKLFWWVHNSAAGQYSSAKVHRTLHVERINKDKPPKSLGEIGIYADELPGLKPFEYAGE